MPLEQGLERRELVAETESRTPPTAREHPRRVPAQRGATGPVRWLRSDEDVAVLELPALPSWACELIVASVVAEYRSRHPDADHGDVRGVQAGRAPHSRRPRPDALATGRATAARSASSVPATISRRRARVAAV